jgi:two-component system, cell cycle sensor histidine kinase and response regulator CckA
VVVDQKARNLAFESSTLPIVVMDPQNFRYLDCNPAAAAVFGFSSVEETLSKTMIDVSPNRQYNGERSSKKLQDYIERALDMGSVVYEWRYRRPDGREWDAEVHLMRLVAEDTELLQLMLLDISKRKKAEKALRSSEARFRVLFEQAGVAIVILDKKEVFIDCNQKALQLFGCTIDQLLGETPWRFSPPVQPDGRESAVSAREKIMTAMSEGPVTFPWIHMRYDGTLFDTEVVVSTVQVDQEILIFGVIRDITERNRAEQERDSLQAQLVQSQKMEAIGRLAGGVAHDFNNLLGVILGRTDLMLENIDADHPLRADLISIQDATERSAALTRQLLAFARKQPVAPRALDLNETVEGMLKMLRRLIGEDIALIWKPGSELAEVTIDPSQVDQILANLCVNARDAIQGVGRIVIETAHVELDSTGYLEHAGCALGEYVMLAVSDSGCGMSVEVRERIFEPFFTTKSVGEGSGLGLSTVYGIVRQNGGTIYVDSNLGGGTTFRIYLPRSVSSSDSRRSSWSGSIISGQGETVLLVEDEPILCDLAQSMLEKLGFQVLAAGLPSEAISLCSTHSGDISLLVTDVIMPEMDGRELKEKLCEIRPELKCLYMSGYTADVIAHHGVLDNGVHFLAKPFTLKDLSSKVFEVLA